MSFLRLRKKKSVILLWKEKNSKNHKFGGKSIQKKKEWKKSGKKKTREVKIKEKWSAEGSGKYVWGLYQWSVWGEVS